ncbi:MAG: potassium-transporting ATPase subunit F [Saprospirales bacterium]|nr:potassium-transporting ATPase subunit F [Saprospirales bacterium]
MASSSCQSLRNLFNQKKMIALLLLSAAVGCYLLYAIVKPEKF